MDQVHCTHSEGTMIIYQLGWRQLKAEPHVRLVSCQVTWQELQDELNKLLLLYHACKLVIPDILFLCFYVFFGVKFKYRCVGSLHVYYCLYNCMSKCIVPYVFPFINERTQEDNIEFWLALFRHATHGSYQHKPDWHKGVWDTVGLRLWVSVRDRDVIVTLFGYVWCNCFNKTFIIYRFTVKVWVRFRPKLGIVSFFYV